MSSSLISSDGSNTFGGYHHKRMKGRSMTEHVDAMRRYRNAVADLL